MTYRRSNITSRDIKKQNKKKRRDNANLTWDSLAENASAIAAAMVWVLRDGFGMVGSLLFSYVVSSHMDSNIKEWRLFADIANDVGLTLDLVAPIFRDNFALISSLGTVCKASNGGAP